MIKVNQQNKLPVSALKYRLSETVLITVVGLIVLFCFEPFLQSLFPTSERSVVTFFWVASSGFLIGSFIREFLLWRAYRYVVTEESLVITSGLITTETKHINFHNIQSIKITHGPLANAFNLVWVKGATSSPEQIAFALDGQSETNISMT